MKTSGGTSILDFLMITVFVLICSVIFAAVYFATDIGGQKSAANTDADGCVQSKSMPNVWSCGREYRKICIGGVMYLDANTMTAQVDANGKPVTCGIEKK